MVLKPVDKKFRTPIRIKKAEVTFDGNGYKLHILYARDLADEMKIYVEASGPLRLEYTGPVISEFNGYPVQYRNIHTFQFWLEYTYQNQTDYYGPLLPRYFQDKIVRALRRAERVMLEKAIRQKALIWKPILEGTKCPRCFDEILNASTDPNCPICHGTGLLEKAIGPIEVYISVMNQTNERESGKFQMSVENQSAFYVPPPLLKAGDVVKLRDGVVYNVVQTSDSLFRRELLSQRLILSRMPDQMASKYPETVST